MIASVTQLRFFTRRLYSFPGTGLPRIAESIRRYVARNALKNAALKDVWIQDFRGNLYFRCDLSEHMGSQIFFRGAYSDDQLALLPRLLPKNGVFVDAGANQGEFSVYAASIVVCGRVHAFEPVPTVRERLIANLGANKFRNIEVHSFGLSDVESDDIPIYGGAETFSDGTEHGGLPTLYKVQGRSRPIGNISLRRLDDCLLDSDRLDLLKIDVEGAELFVLKGAERSINRKRPYIIFEANEETCRAAGYTVATICEWLTEKRYTLNRIGCSGKISEFKDFDTFCNILAIPAERTVYFSDLSK